MDSCVLYAELSAHAQKVVHASPLWSGTSARSSNAEIKEHKLIKFLKFGIKVQPFSLFASLAS